MKTLAQLKRDAKNGKLKARLVERFGSTDIPERLRGERRIVGSNSVGITFLNNDGKKSECRIKSASLVEYTDKHITIYRAGLRNLTEDEQAIFNEWDAIRDKEAEMRDLMTDGSSQFWRKKYFFTNKGYEYLLGHEEKQGKKYDYNTGKVYDNKIKGEVELKYELYI